MSSSSSLGMSIGGCIAATMFSDSAAGACVFFALSLTLCFFTFACGADFSTLGIISLGSCSFQFAENTIKQHYDNYL